MKAKESRSQARWLKPSRGRSQAEVWREDSELKQSWSEIWPKGGGDWAEGRLVPGRGRRPGGGLVPSRGRRTEGGLVPGRGRRTGGGWGPGSGRSQVGGRSGEAITEIGIGKPSEDEAGIGAEMAEQGRRKKAGKPKSSGRQIGKTGRRRRRRPKGRSRDRDRAKANTEVGFSGEAEAGK